MARPTIAEIARRAHVSKMTISRVINDRPGVSRRLRARVQKVIAHMGYVPSALAHSLAAGRSDVIGMFVPDIISEWITPLILGVGEAVAALGFQMLLRTTGRGEAFRPDAHDLLIRSELASGLIVASWRVPLAFAQQMTRVGTPIVIIDGFARPDDVLWVSAADRAGASEITQHLIALGHRRIAFIGGGESYLAQQRLAGFLDGLTSARLKPQKALLLQGDFTRESGYDCAAKLLSRPDRPTAIFAANDPMAVGVLQAAHDRRLALPRELSVVGFDDTLAAGTYPALTTIARDYKEMGRAAMRLLADQLNRRTAPGAPVQIDIPTRLVVRKSTAPAARTRSVQTRSAKGGEPRARVTR
jgi:LacI family transcriptional regulator